MKVEELIEKLRDLDPGAEIFTHSYNGHIAEPEIKKICIVRHGNSVFYPALPSAFDEDGKPVEYYIPATGDLLWAFII